MSASGRLLAELKLLHPKLIDLSLGRIERLLAKLGHPERRLPPVIHVAGTNGKGSVTAYVAAMMEAAGYRVHVYTSPHLVRFHERIRLAGRSGAGQPIGEPVLADVLSRVQAVNGGEPITQFEITTAAAFLAFAEHPADAVLLEVGLGGRLDATNVVAEPALCIITPVSVDHADKLGAALDLIAAEKAGILKKGVKGVISAQEPAALVAIRRQSERVGAPLSVWGEDYAAIRQGGRLVLETCDQVLDLPLPALMGPHQIINAGTAAMAALALEGTFDISEYAIGRGLVEACWPARMQRLDGGVLTGMVKPGTEIWLDGGHNPAAGRALAETLADLDERAPKPVHLIAGMLRLKDAAGFLAPFRGLVRGMIAVPVPGTPEAAFAPEALAETARLVGLAAEPAASVELALQRLEQVHPGSKRVLICGSLYLAGHVLAAQQGLEAEMN